MRQHLKAYGFIALLIACAGCNSSPLPPADKVAEIRLSVNHMPDEKFDPKAAPRVANIKAKADIAEIMDWLLAIDWSQSGQDMAVIGIPQPDGGFTITDKSAATYEFGFYWDGKFVNSKANRLLKAGNTDKLKQIVKKHMK
jgi:hypothetical protein